MVLVCLGLDPIPLVFSEWMEYIKFCSVPSLISLLVGRAMQPDVLDMNWILGGSWNGLKLRSVSDKKSIRSIYIYFISQSSYKLLI